MGTDSGALGFGHFIAHTDVVGRTLLAILIAMSIASWAIIAVKGLTLMLRKSRGAATTTASTWLTGAVGCGGAGSGSGVSVGGGTMTASGVGLAVVASRLTRIGAACTAASRTA